MSHIIRISIQNQKIYETSCDNLINKLEKINSSNSVNQDYKKGIDSLIRNISSLKSSFAGSMESESYYRLTRDLSTLEKEVANLYITARDQVLDDLISSLPPEFNISKVISDHGPLAIETLDYLRQNNIQQNQENFDKYMPIVKEKQLSQEKIKNYITNAYKMIDECKIPDSIKYGIKNRIRNIKDMADIKDIYAVIQSKEDETIRTVELINKVIELLEKQNFKRAHDPKNKNNYWHKWIYDEENDKIVFKFRMINDSNNTVEMVVDSMGDLEYKLGNYIGHACEKTTEKLLKDLNEQGFITREQFRRDFETNDKVMRKQIDKSKDGGK